MHMDIQLVGESHRQFLQGRPWFLLDPSLNEGFVWIEL